MKEGVVIFLVLFYSFVNYLKKYRLVEKDLNFIKVCKVEFCFNLDIFFKMLKVV